VFWLLILYVLSSGPIHALYATGRLHSPMPEGVTTFYKPVRWLYAETPLGKPMTTYDAWWKRVLKPSSPTPDNKKAEAVSRSRLDGF